MSHDCIKLLIKCEKEAKEIIRAAKEERTRIKQRAKSDAQEIIKASVEQKKIELVKLQKRLEESIAKEAEKIHDEFLLKIKSLDNCLDGKESIVDYVVDSIAQVNY